MRGEGIRIRIGACSFVIWICAFRPQSRHTIDRKSTRLNSSHSQISYAVFCLKKKNQSSPAHEGGHSRLQRLLSGVRGSVEGRILTRLDYTQNSENRVLSQLGMPFPS